ncbi:HpcH/HpaI aldolase/citrate lyase family protein [Rhodococcus sp. AG1013]|uniref:HpcH/HpaI aldolase/citrate lyase family protein n=1 Tax=unclassified Rhodococcus (in: high G+C Gram-positive bacteria) TaxID=192944 RepID=UPI000E0BBC0B|nr:CoA ester lyase [Rhodococcus sp. AG1013]RDI31352.1 citrate lyase subunit beta/citryl-CoA lyase [Rhodococcus sp. AG1013]
MTTRTQQSERHTVRPDLARSWLLTAATKPDGFTRPEHVDAIILDLEDAVTPDRKPEARDAVTAWLSGRGEAWVRINDATTPYWEQDLRALTGLPGLHGVMLAKTESGGQVDATSELLPDTPVLALIESAVGLEAAPEIARADGTFRLAFGSGDFRRDTGMSDDVTAMAYPRSRLVIASRAARLAGGPIDGPTVSANETILQRDCEATVSLGLTGKLCLHPDQASAVNRALSPSPHDITWAHDVISDLGSDGERVRDGSDLPRLAKAKKITHLADVFGLD